MENNLHAPIPKGAFNVTEADIGLMRELLSAEFDEGKNSLPEYLYQYRTLNFNTLDQINNKYIWCASPLTFNDIFDSKALYKIIETVYQKVDNSTLEEVNKDDVIDMFLDQLRISSFTSKDLNQTMWSHYANRYAGICIKYDAEFIKKHIYKVHYPDKMEVIKDVARKLFNMIKQKPNSSLYNESMLLALLSSLFKNKSWRYEEEYRYVSFSCKVRDNKVQLNPVEIIFGPKVDDRNINIVKNLVSKDQTPLAKIVLDKDNIEFKIESIEP